MVARSLIVAAVVCLLTGPASTRQLPAAAQPLTTGKRTLVVYLSRTNNTRAVAAMINQEVGGTMVALELETPYPADYQTTVRQVARENETGSLPRLRTRIDNVQQYDVVFLGFPTWGMQLPPPMKTFLKEHDLKGKAVIPFNTNAGYGEGSSFRTVRELCAGCTVLEGFTTRGGVERDGTFLVIEGARAEEVRREVQSWLKRIGQNVAGRRVR